MCKAQKQLFSAYYAIIWVAATIWITVFLLNNWNICTFEQLPVLLSLLKHFLSQLQLYFYKNNLLTVKCILQVLKAINKYYIIQNKHNGNENSFTIQYFTHPFLITSSQCFSTCREDLALQEYVELLNRQLCGFCKGLCQRTFSVFG